MDLALFTGAFHKPFNSHNNPIIITIIITILQVRKLRHRDISLPKVTQLATGKAGTHSAWTGSWVHALNPYMKYNQWLNSLDGAPLMGVTWTYIWRANPSDRREADHHPPAGVTRTSSQGRQGGVWPLLNRVSTLRNHCSSRAGKAVQGKERCQRTEGGTSGRAFPNRSYGEFPGPVVERQGELVWMPQQHAGWILLSGNILLQRQKGGASNWRQSAIPEPPNSITC